MSLYVSFRNITVVREFRLQRRVRSWQGEVTVRGRGRGLPAPTPRTSQAPPGSRALAEWLAGAQPPKALCWYVVSPREPAVVAQAGVLRREDFTPLRTPVTSGAVLDCRKQAWGSVRGRCSWHRGVQAGGAPNSTARRMAPMSAASRVVSPPGLDRDLTRGVPRGGASPRLSGLSCCLCPLVWGPFPPSEPVGWPDPSSHHLLSAAGRGSLQDSCDQMGPPA